MTPGQIIVITLVALFLGLMAYAIWDQEIRN
jgi:hypothetical protein